MSSGREKTKQWPMASSPSTHSPPPQHGVEEEAQKSQILIGKNVALDPQLLRLGWTAALGSGGQSLVTTPPQGRWDTPLGHHLFSYCHLRLGVEGGRYIQLPSCRGDRRQSHDQRGPASLWG